MQFISRAIQYFYFLLLAIFCLSCSTFEQASVAVVATSVDTPILPSTKTSTSTPPPFPEKNPTATLNQSSDILPTFHYNSWEIVHDLTYSPDGRLLAVSAGDRIHIYDAATLGEEMVIPVRAWANRLAFHPFLPILALAVKDGSVQFRDIATGETICQFIAHEKGVNSLSITPDGEMLITSGTEILSRLWNISSLSNGNCEIQEIGTFIGESFSSPDVAFSPDGKLTALVDLTNIRLRKTSDRKLIALLESENPIFDIAFSPDGHWLAAAQHRDSVSLWDLSQVNDPVPTILQPPNPDLETYTWRVAFNPESELLAAGASDGTVAVWDLTVMKLVETYPLPRGVSAAAFSPDGKFLAAGGLDASVWLFPLDP